MSRASEARSSNVEVIGIMVDVIPRVVGLGQIGTIPLLALIVGGPRGDYDKVVCTLWCNGKDGARRRR